MTGLLFVKVDSEKTGEHVEVEIPIWRAWQGFDLTRAGFSGFTSMLVTKVDEIWILEAVIYGEVD